MDGGTTSKIAIGGAGKLGEAMLAAWRARGLGGELVATARRAERIEHLERTLGVVPTRDNAAAVRGAAVVVVSVKPHDMPRALDEIAPALEPGALVVSVAAGVKIAAIEARLAPGTPVIRAMPNTAVRIGAGMTVLAPGARATEAHLAIARTMFEAVGRVMVLEERHLDAVTGLSASGPAFIYVVMESMAEGGVKAGLPRKVATELVAQAMLGAARMVLETGAHPALLKDDVTTPAGCTIDGLLELEVGGLRVALIKAIVTTTKRAGELG